MKQGIIIVALVLAISSAFASDASIGTVNCQSTQKAAGEGVQNEIYVQLKDITIHDDGGRVQVGQLTATFVSKYIQFGVIENVDSGTLTSKDLQNVSYRGVKYKNHWKFPLTSKSALKSGSFFPDQASLIFSPAFAVVRTAHESNHWTPAWTWDVEVRQHSAVLAINMTDQDGGYWPMDCYSTAIVNEHKP